MGNKAIRMLVRLGISLALFVVFLLHTSGTFESRLLTTLENLTYDNRLRLSMPETVDPRVVIVDIDEKSMAAEGQWPWPRDTLGRLVTELFDTYHVRVVGFDMIFSEPDRQSGRELFDRLATGPLADLPGFSERAAAARDQLDTDRALAEAIRGRAVVLGYVFRAPTGAEDSADRGLPGPVLIDKVGASQLGVPFPRAEAFTPNLPVLHEATPHTGFFDLPTLDADGVVRDAPLMQEYRGQLYPSLALEVLRVTLGAPPVQLEFDPPEARAGLNLERVRVGEVAIPVDETASMLVPYRGRQFSFPYVPATDVLKRAVDPKVLEGAIVFVGTTAPGLKDLRSTPVGPDYPGVEVHANVVSGALDGRIRQRAPYYAGMETVTLLALGLLLAWLFPKVTAAWALAVVIVLIAAGTGLSVFVWEAAHLVMPTGVPVTYTLVVFLAQLLYGYFIEARRARDTAKTFGQYVPKEIVEEMAASNLRISMEGRSHEMTVLFSDVRGFTTISEQFKDRPQELSELMNNFLTPLTQIIQKYRGTIDKYMGDCIMAFWGAPLDDPEHATHALQAAIELPRAMRALEADFAKRGWPPLHIGVGLSTGNMRVGNMGSEFRVAYTVMGDPVNLGSRVEGLTKEYGVAIICSEFTRAAGPPDWSYRELDQVRVKGKEVPVSIYEPMGPKDALDPAVRQDLARHRGALKLYRAQKWEEAEAEFFSLSRGANPQKVYELFMERIAYYRKNPPGEKWDGVFTFKTK
ncbi:MAG: CHASE2 domain-containing protein [Nevskiaceae bacterium]